MHEIEVALLANVIQQVSLAQSCDLAPAHVWHRVLCICAQLAYCTRDDTQAVHILFLGGVSQQLHTKANAEYGLLKAANDINELCVPEALHGVASGTYPGKDYLLRRADDGRVAS